jgi:hypothetical protein
MTKLARLSRVHCICNCSVIFFWPTYYPQRVAFAGFSGGYFNFGASELSTYYAAILCLGGRNVKSQRSEVSLNTKVAKAAKRRMLNVQGTRLKIQVRRRFEHQGREESEGGKHGKLLAGRRHKGFFVGAALCRDS